MGLDQRRVFVIPANISVSFIDFLAIRVPGLGIFVSMKRGPSVGRGSITVGANRVAHLIPAFCADREGNAMTIHQEPTPDDSSLVTDPVCEMKIDPTTAAATREHDGTIFYFCSTGCADTFDADPHRYGHPHAPH
jgi:YHS domain-containing protein